MASLLYTTTNAVRAAIGLTEKEVPNDSFVDLSIEDQLVIYLTRSCPTYAAIAAAGQATSPTDEEKALWRALKLVCMYEAGYLTLQSNQYLVSQQIESGGVTTTRFSKDDIETILARMAMLRDDYLGVVLGDATLTDEDFVCPFVRVTPGYDPVRGC